MHSASEAIATTCMPQDRQTDRTWANLTYINDWHYCFTKAAGALRLRTSTPPSYHLGQFPEYSLEDWRPKQLYQTVMHPTGTTQGGEAGAITPCKCSSDTVNSCRVLVYTGKESTWTILATLLRKKKKKRYDSDGYGLSFKQMTYLHSYTVKIKKWYSFCPCVPFSSWI